MKIVLAGGSGHLGGLLSGHFGRTGHEVVVLSRAATTAAANGGRAAAVAAGRGQVRPVAWDGRTVGPWAAELDGADAVINLAGRSVDCRYTKENLRDMFDSRVDSTRALGAAIAAVARPPRVWLQSSTATIYAHRFDAANDEASGVIGGAEPDAPPYWRFSIDIASAWEAELSRAATPATRKVALRTAMVMSRTPRSVFAVLLRLTRLRLNGAMAGGRQYVSWIHERDFVRACDWLLTRDDFAGVVNVCAPEPLPQREFARQLRSAAGVRLGLPAAAWMLELGAVVLRTDSELLLKSRRVVPGRLLQAGFAFDSPRWAEAAAELVGRRGADPAGPSAAPAVAGA